MYENWPIFEVHFKSTFPCQIDFHFFGGPKGPPNKSVYPKMLVQIQYLSEYNWAEEVGGGGKGQGGPGR